MSEKPAVFIKPLTRYEPDTVYIGTGDYVAECVRAEDGDYYLAADVDAVLEELLAEVERLKSMTAMTMGVGSGDGNLFVHGDYESIKAAQAIVLERDALQAEVERLNRILGRIVDGDGDSTLTIRMGTDAFAAAKEYLLRDQEGGEE